jgi:GNAT superfamily N-acetyltransferase
MTEVAINIREGEPSDAPFLLSGWLCSHRHSPSSWGIKGPTYYGEHRRIVEALLRRCTVLIACDPAEPAIIHGWCVAEVVDSLLLVHFIYVRGGFQDLGIGTALVKYLLDACPDTPALACTHMTKSGYSWFRKMVRRGTPVPLIYNPYLVYRSLGAAL